MHSTKLRTCTVHVDKVYMTRDGKLMTADYIFETSLWPIINAHENSMIASLTILCLKMYVADT